MSNKIIIRPKNEDGSYSDNSILFDGIDLYDGCNVYKILELSSDNGVAKNVKLTLEVQRNDLIETLLPKIEDAAELKTGYYPGLDIWFTLTGADGVKLIPDKNGVINLTKQLTVPMDVVMHVKASKYTVSSLNESVVLDDLFIVTWCSGN